MEETRQGLQKLQRREGGPLHKKRRRRRKARDSLREILRENDRIIERLGDRIGGYTEGMAFPSMEKVLRKRFGMQVVGCGVCARHEGRFLEPDVLAFSQGGETPGQAFVVQVKSRLHEEAVREILHMLGEFFDFLPDFRGKELYGILAAKQIPQQMRRRVLDEGLYLAQVRGEVFQIQVPRGFKPRNFGAEPTAEG